MRKPIIAGNWKMNKSPSESIELVKEILNQDMDENVEQDKLSDVNLPYMDFLENIRFNWNGAYYFAIDAKIGS